MKIVDSPGGRLVEVEVRGPVVRLWLDRPEQRNALSLEMLDALGRALDEAAAVAGARAIVLGGRGPAFSAGHDLREMRVASARDVEELFRRCESVMARLHRVAVPVIARVHGIATAAGCQLVAACDLAVAAEEATFATPGIKVGLFCSTPAVPLVRSVGRKRALEMLLSGRPVPAATALEWGLVNRVVPDAALLDETVALAQRIAHGPRNSFALTKRLLAESHQALERQLDLEGRTIAAQGASPEGMEGMHAFLQKRPAKFG